MTAIPKKKADMPFDLPKPAEGWAVAKMGDIAEVVGGGTPKTADEVNFADDGHAWITPADLSGFKEIYLERGKRFLSDQGLKACSAKVMPKGTVLMSSRAPIGYLAIAASPICTNQGFKSFVCQRDIMPEYVLLWLKFIKPFLENMGSGSTFMEISGTRAREIPILLAPVGEQERIAAKVLELLSRVNAAHERLAKVQEILKRFRQSVLAAACSGRLTADWRNKNSNVESAKEMMENLLQIQENALKTKNEEFDLKTLREKFGYLAKDNQRFASSGDIPDKWVSASFYNLCILQRGFDLPTQKRHPGKYPIVSSSGISGSHNKAKVKGPCVCVGRSGSVGKTYYVEEDAWPLNTTLYVKEFNGNYPKFVYYYLFYMELEKFSSSTAVPTLNRNTFTFEEVNSPPVKEQKEIARRLDSVFKITDSVMNRKTTAIEQIERLEQSILSKAFRGELVTTEAELARNEDRSYEPASALLERVRRERMTPKTSRPKRGKKHISKAKRMDKRNGKLSRFVKLKAFSVLGHNAVHLLSQIEEEIGDREFSIEEVYTLTSLERGELKSAFFELLNPFAEKKEHESVFVKMKFSKAKGGYIYKLERGK